MEELKSYSQNRLLNSISPFKSFFKRSKEWSVIEDDIHSNRIFVAGGVPGAVPGQLPHPRLHQQPAHPGRLADRQGGHHDQVASAHAVPPRHEVDVCRRVEKNRMMCVSLFALN